MDSNLLVQAEAILRIAGAFMPVFLFVSPLAAVNRISRQKKTDGMFSLPFTSMFCNCALWLTFGIGLRETSMIIPNVVGSLLGSYYVAIYSLNCNSGEWDRALREVVVTVVCIVTAISLLQFDSTEEVGTLCMLVNIVMYSSPVLGIGEVLTTGNTTAMGTVEMAVASLACSIVWFLLGVQFLKKKQVWIPNAVGVVINAIVLFLFFFFSKGGGRSRRGRSRSRKSIASQGFSDTGKKTPSKNKAD